MPTLTVALICHDNDEVLQKKLREIEGWTRQPDEWILLFSAGAKLTLPDGMRVISRPDRNDKGYDKRAVALREAKSDFILFANYDDRHKPDCIEKLMAAVEPHIKIVHCISDGKHGKNIGTKFLPCNSGAENHIVRCDVALEIGGYEAAMKRDERADKPLITMLNQVVQPGEIAYVPEVLVTLL